jgi:hypothetical protein
MSKVTVTVAKVPGDTNVVELDGDVTLVDVVSAAKLAFNGTLSISLNGKKVTAEEAKTTKVNDGDRVSASNGASGAK